MDPKLISELKTRLEKEREIVDEQLKGFAKKDRAIKGDWDAKFPRFSPGHTLEEEADEVEEYENLKAIEYALELKLNEINQALERIEKNNFGKCQVCHKEIETERILAIPETKTCNQCKK